ncbi:MAG: hypothetical protein K0R15_1636 [Clostridiales bacterium]|jgi:hypothetical protein|nr:hypothetical protein [Clostridiales bacterium]
MKLSGIVDYTMGNFLCLRGYASFKDLSRISQPNPDYQRPLIDNHKGDMARFLNQGEYLFFPEVILSLSLATNGNYDEIRNIQTIISAGDTWNGSLGDFKIDMSKNETKSHSGGVNRVRLGHITFDESKIKLNRIDGNHRMSAADETISDFKTPFCILLFANEQENEKFSRAIFHNVNAKQIPLKLEENLKVILDNDLVYSDTSLTSSFGYNYYLARKTLKSIDLAYFANFNTYIGTSKYTFFVALFEYLISNNSIPNTDESIEIIKGQLVDIETALAESQVVATTTNIAIIGALAYYKLTNQLKYRGFMSWIKKNNLGNVQMLHIGDVIKLYDEIAAHTPKRAFLARWYPSETDSAYTKSKHRIDAMKQVADELNLDLTDLGTKDTGAFDIREVMYHDIRECDVFIADLTGARHNVMIEVGYALKHIGTGRMVFYFQETENCKAVPFDISHLAYDLIVDSAEIKSKTKTRIQKVILQAMNGEI